MSQHKRSLQRGNSGQEGSALVLAVFILALLTAMGAALLFLSQTSVKAGEASIRPKKAFYYAEAGLEHARQALWKLNNAQDFEDDLRAAAGGVTGDPIHFDPETIEPVFDAKGNVTGFTGYGNDVPLISVRALDDGWYAAFMSNDHGEGRTNPVDTDNRVILTGVGVGPDRSVEVVEAVIDIQNVMPGMPPSSIFLLGNQPQFLPASSNSKEYSGNDCGLAGGEYYPIVGVTGATQESAIEASLAKNPEKYDPAGTKGPDFISGPYSTAADTISNMSASPVQAMSDSTYTMEDGWENCLAMKEMVEAYRLMADVVCPNDSKLAKSSCPADVSHASGIYFGDGNLELSENVQYRGTVIATGQLILSGSVDFDGVLMAIGEGYFNLSGAGNGMIRGSIVVADIAGPDGIYGTGDDCTGGQNGFGDSIYDENGGGNSGTGYCSTVVQASNHAKPYEILEFRQR